MAEETDWGGVAGAIIAGLLIIFVMVYCIWDCVCRKRIAPEQNEVDTVSSSSKPASAPPSPPPSPPPSLIVSIRDAPEKEEGRSPPPRGLQ
mmetsp:Transcript_70656/g.140042  ORF Transcript_70656/g.140042 Transcript_70656/m.140042 type:complete len:91 (+) Transcript_70656:65-337(+)